MSRTSGRACNSIFLPRNSRSALLTTELGSQFFQQKWQFRVPGEFSGTARTAKTLLHEMDLKVAELALSGAAKHSVEGLGTNPVQFIPGMGIVVIRSHIARTRTASRQAPILHWESHPLGPPLRAASPPPPISS